MKINSIVTTILGQVAGIINAYFVGGGELNWKAFAAYLATAIVGKLIPTFTIGKKETI